MKDYLLFLDVSADLDRQYAQDGTVHTLPMDFIINGEANPFTDDDKGLDIGEFYSMLKNGAEAKTTQITPGIYEEYFAPYLQNGQDVLYLCLSSGLSSTFDSATMAAKNLKERFPNAEFLPMDTLGATGKSGVIAEKMIANKKAGMSLHQNFDDLQQYKLKTTACGFVDDLSSLVRGGRLSKGKAMVGKLLDIKPLIAITEDGRLVNFGKSRGIKLSINKLVEWIAERINLDATNNVVYVSHANEEANAIVMRNKLLEVAPNAQIKVRQLSPIIGAHMGPGAVVVGFETK